MRVTKYQGAGDPVSGCSGPIVRVRVTQCQGAADPVSGFGSPSVRVWLTQCQVMHDLFVPMGPAWLGFRKKPERKNEQMRGGRLDGNRWAAAPATILTDGAAHRASQAGPTQLTHLSLWV